MTPQVPNTPPPPTTPTPPTAPQPGNAPKGFVRAEPGYDDLNSKLAMDDADILDTDFDGGTFGLSEGMHSKTFGVDVDYDLEEIWDGKSTLPTYIKTNAAAVAQAAISVFNAYKQGAVKKGSAEYQYMIKYLPIAYRIQLPDGRKVQAFLPNMDYDFGVDTSPVNGQIRKDAALFLRTAIIEEMAKSVGHIQANKGLAKRILSAYEYSGEPGSNTARDYSAFDNKVMHLQQERGRVAKRGGKTVKLGYVAFNQEQGFHLAIEGNSTSFNLKANLGVAFLMWENDVPHTSSTRMYTAVKLNANREMADKMYGVQKDGS